MTSQTISSPVIEKVRSVAGQDLHAHLFFPVSSSAPCPVVVLAHGGAWVRGNADLMYDCARRLVEAGFVAVSVEYRLSNWEAVENKTARETDPTPADALDDICAAIGWLRANSDRLNIDAERISALGFSAGGQLVAAAAMADGIPADQRPNALMLWSSVIDLEFNTYFQDLLLGRGDRMAFSPFHLITATTPPTMLIQGDLDPISQISQARRFHARMNAHGRLCELHIFKDTDHDFPPELEPEVMRRCIVFLRRVGMTPHC